MSEWRSGLKERLGEWAVQAAYGLLKDENYVLALFLYNIADMSSYDPNYISFMKARCYWVLKQYAKAESEYLKLLEAVPNHEDGISALAMLYSEQGMYEKSLEFNTRHLQLYPNSATGYNNRGFVRSLMGDYENAVIDLEKSRKLNPEFAFAWNNLGLAKFAIGEHEQEIPD